jgi:hypothetical protein
MIIVYRVSDQGRHRPFTFEPSYSKRGNGLRRYRIKTSPPPWLMEPDWCAENLEKCSKRPSALSPSENGRGGKTASELFMSVVRGLGGRIAAFLRQVAG